MAVLAAGVVFAVILTVRGCSSRSAGAAATEETTVEEVTEEPTVTPAGLTASQLKEAGVNELNSVPIMMYHRIINALDEETGYTGGNADEWGLSRTSESLARDLANYYEWGYRCIRLADFVDGNIDTEFGYSPIILTFDDGSDQISLEGFDEEGNPIFAEGCALAILEEFKAEHPDFHLTATFFLYGELFHHDTETDYKLLKWLIDNGYDIGNHTRDHWELPDCSEEEIEEEIGYMYNLFEEVIPGRYVNIVALPDGLPADVSEDSKYDKIFSGTYNDMEYTTSAALLGSWMYSDSCFADSLDTTAIRRIRAYDNNGEEYDIDINFNLLNNGIRYVSDGDPSTIVYPKINAAMLGDTHGKTAIGY